MAVTERDGELAADERVEIKGSATEVWHLRADFTRLAEYNPDVSDVREVGEGAAGPRYEFSLRTPGGSHHVVLEIIERQTDRLVVAIMRGVISARERFTVTELGPGRIEARLQLWLEIPEGFPAEHRQAMLENGQRQVRAELDAMRVIVEGGPAGLG